ncbi:S41 family peptidase [Mucilaginibacter sabulilitoris]|uniref:S41 family peptidase n=1 Tax=Mucilaginibacter sabulilitoris TaxID=1173583 RepID=A0ABZ0TFE1_9SPHI|nr:S41 family peptidase [Mucilaginibacter sabulilitoris]WPU91479.1 S41 family peptidase [Mucilaginibacter sabulilitoris]
MRKSGIIVLIGIVTGVSACEKVAEIPADIPISPTTGTRVQFTLDSIFLYARQIYLWNDIIPTYAAFNPRGYATGSDAAGAFEKELFDITQLKINPQTSMAYEAGVSSGTPKYSFLTEKGEGGNLAAVGSPSLPALLKDTIIINENKPVAYIALGSFPELYTCQTVLDEAFSKFAVVSPQQLVVDLRSNGGGFVETAEYIANLIAPQSLNGKVMFSEQYNSLLQNGQATILKNQPYLDANGKPVTYMGRQATMADVDYTESANTHRFNKKGSLQSVKDIYFITSFRTASASELLISSLKPYFNIKLVGETTFGKPVGFFPVTIDIYSVYLSSFLIRNAQGWSAYFQGIPPDVFVAEQDNPVLGDPMEACLSNVLKLINGSSGLNTVNKKTVQANIFHKRASSSISLVQNSMIENRLKLKTN